MSFESPPLMNLHERGSRVGRITPGSFAVLTGFTDMLKYQLIEKSRQPHIKATTPADAESRFVDIHALERRLKPEFMHYLLVKCAEDPIEDDLAAYVWLHRKAYQPTMGQHAFKRLEEPTYEEFGGTTYANRTYEGYLGQGLGNQLSRLAIQDYFAINPDESGIWITYNQTNGAGRASHKKLGFVDRMAEPVGPNGRMVATLSRRDFDANNKA